MSGLGLFDARINGAPLTDEVLAPGYSNYQLSAEYRTYDVTSKLRGGANTIGVELGQGTAHNVKMANPAAGATNSFAWWNSSAVGSGTLLDAAPAGATNVRVSSVASYYVGGTINVDTGDGGERFESRTITAIGTAPSSTALAFPAAAGDTNVKVTSVAGLGVGDTLRFEGGGTATVTAVGTARSQTTLFAPVAAGATNVKLASVTGIVAGNTLVVDGETAHGHRGRHAGSRDDALRGGRRGRDEHPRAPASPASSPTARSRSAARPRGSRRRHPGRERHRADPGRAARRGRGQRRRRALRRHRRLLHARARGRARAERHRRQLRLGPDAVGARSTARTPPARRSPRRARASPSRPALDSAHAAGSLVTGSGNPIAALDASAGAQVTPRLIGRLEITYTDGTTETIVTNRDWRAAFGPAVTDHWFGGTDYDARRERGRRE